MVYTFVTKVYIAALKLFYCYLLLWMARMEMDWNLKIKIAMFLKFSICVLKILQKILWIALSVKFHLTL